MDRFNFSDKRILWPGGPTELVYRDDTRWLLFGCRWEGPGLRSPTPSDHSGTSEKAEEYFYEAPGTVIRFGEIDWSQEGAVVQRISQEATLRRWMDRIGQSHTG